MHRIVPNRGFTLIELLITIAIAVVLVTLAVPSMKAMIEGNAVNNHVKTFVSDLRYARSEAIKAGVPVVMCRSSNSESAAPTCTTAGDSEWKTGWLIFVNRDLNGSNTYSSNGGDTLLRVQAAYKDSGGIAPSSTVDKFVFRPTGLMSAGASTITFNSITLDGSRQQVICVSMQGRARKLKDSTSACNSTDA